MLIRRGSAILRSPDPDPTGGAPQGGAPDDSQPGDPPKTLTEEDIGRIANAAITSQLKRLNIQEKINEAIGGLKLDDKFNSLTEMLQKAQAPQPAPQQGGNSPAPDDQAKALQKQLQTLAEQVEQEKAARVQAEQNARAAEELHQFNTGRQRLYESLKEHADPNLHDVWVDYLIHHKRLKVEEGTPLLEVEHSPVKGMPKQKEYLPLEEALPHLVSSQESKRFMSAPAPAGGPGSPAPRGRRPAGTAGINSNNPLDRVAARLEGLGLSFDEEFNG